MPDSTSLPLFASAVVLMFEKSFHLPRRICLNLGGDAGGVKGILKTARSMMNPRCFALQRVFFFTISYDLVPKNKKVNAIFENKDPKQREKISAVVRLTTRHLIFHFHNILCQLGD